MQTIRRLKGDQMHFAKSLDVSGAVTAWLFGEGAAVDATRFEDAAVAQVRRFYSTRPEAGLLQFVNESGNVVHEQGDQDDTGLDAPPVRLDSLVVQVREQQIEIDLLKERVETVEGMVE